MKIGDRIYVRGYIDEIRKDTVIIRNNGGYFGTVLSEVTGELPSAQPEPIKINIEDFNKEDLERFKKEWENTPITVLPSARPEPCEDAISRQAAMEMLMAQNVIMDGSEYHNGFNAGVNRAQEVIRNLPPVQKHGKWIHHEGGYSDHYECTACGKAIVLTGRWKFCPNCGADMRTKETDCDYERAVEQLEHDMLYEPTFTPDDGSM